MGSKWQFTSGSRENVAFRIRRKFLLVEGGNPQHIFVYYSMGQAVRESLSPSNIYPTLSTFPIRALRLYSNFMNWQP